MRQMISSEKGGGERTYVANNRGIRTRPPRARVLERGKNGRRARADVGRMGPSALDRENSGARSSVRSRGISRGRHCVPRLRQRHENTGSPVLRTPLYGSWDRLCSLVVAGCRGALG